MQHMICEHLYQHGENCRTLIWYLENRIDQERTLACDWCCEQNGALLYVVDKQRFEILRSAVTGSKPVVN